MSGQFASARAVTLSLLLLVSAFAIGFPAGTVTAAGSTDVGFQNADQTVVEGETTTYTVVVSDADGGVGAFTLSASVDSSVATIQNISVESELSPENSTKSVDGSSASLEAFGLNTSDTGSVAIATVTVEGTTAGSSAVDLELQTLGDENGDAYTVSTVQDGTLTVESNSRVVFDPQNQSATEGSEATYDVIVTNVPGDGVGVFDLSVSVNSNVATIQNISVESELSPENSTKSVDGSSASLEAFGLNTSDTGSVAIATVTVEGTTAGSSAVNLQLQALGDEDGDPITVQPEDGSLTVQSPATFDVSDLSAPETVNESESFTVEATVTNTGDVAGDEEVEFRIGDTVEATENVSLNAGENETVRFSGQSLPNASTPTHGVFTGDDNETAQIEVQPIASVTFDNQTVIEGASNVTVARAQFGDGDDGNFTVVVHRVASDDSIGAKIGESNVLASGPESNITVDLQALDGGINNLTQSQELVAMLHTANTGDGDDINHGTNIIRNGSPVTDRAFVTVQEPANLSVTQVDVSDQQPVVGENVTVTATVNNTGDVAGDLTVNFTQNEEVVATEQVSNLAGGATTTVETTVNFNFSQVGSATAGANGQTATLTVQQPADLSVTQVDVSDQQPVVGQNVTVTATVENTGDVAGDLTINFTQNEQVVATEQVSNLAGGATTTVETTVNFNFSQVGSATAGANGQTATLTVQEPADLSVTQVDVSDQQPVVGENITLSATVENAGDVAGDLTVNFTRNGQRVDTVQVSDLAGGANTTVSTTINFSQVGSATAGANGQTATLTVQQPADLSVTQVDVSDQQPVVGQNVTVTATVNNTGDVAGNLAVEFTRNDQRVDTVQVSDLAGGATTTVSTTVNFSQAGPATAGANGQTVNLTVQQPADLSVTQVDVSDQQPVVGENITLSATVENAGDVAGDLTVNFTRNSQVVATEQVSNLTGGANTTVSTTINFSQAGPATAGANGQTATLTVQQPADLSVTQVDVSDQQPVVGQNVTVTATVNNTGDVAGNLTVEFTQNEQVVATEQVSNLAGGATTTVETTVNFNFSQVGSATAGANGETVTLTVQEPADLSVTQVDVSDQQPLVSEDITLSATVENAGDVAGDLTVNFTRNDQVVATEQVSNLAGGANTTVSTTINFSQAGSATAGANGETVTLTVQEPADLSVTQVDVSDQQPLVGENITLTATVENAGDVAGGLTVEFTRNGQVVATEQVSDLAGGATTTVSTTVNFNFSQAGSATAGANGQTVTLTVQEPADLSVTQVDVSDQQPLVGENITLSATVENGGDVAGDLTVNFTRNSQVVATEQVSNLAGGANTTVSTTINFSQAGSATAGANGQTVTLTVQQPADLSVVNVDVSDQQPLVDENITLSATVENAGDVAGDLTVEFTQNEQVVATEQVSDLAGGATTTVSTTVSVDQAGPATAGANGQTVTLTVQQPADLSVVNVDVSDQQPLVGENITLSATVENAGDVAGDLTVEFTRNGQVVATEQVSNLAGGANTTVSTTVNFGQAGPATAGANGQTVNLTVQEPADLSVTQVDVSDQQPLVGENVTLSATVENAGDVAGDLTVEFTRNGQVVATEQVSNLAGGANTTVSTTVNFGQAGPATAGANGETVNLTVQEPADLSVVNVDVSDQQPVVGENVTLSATVENAGDVAGDLTVEFTRNGQVVATEQVSNLAGGANTTVSTTVNFGQAGSVTAGANGETVNLTVQEPADLSVVNVDVSDQQPLVDENVTVTATVENAGDVAGDLTVEFTRNGQVVATEQVSNLAGGTTTTVFTTVSVDQAGSATAGANGQTVTLTVQEPADLSVTQVDVSDQQPVVDQNITLSATVENAGDVAGDLTVSFTQNGQVVATEQVSDLAGGATTTVETTISFGQAGPATAGANGQTVNLTVQEPADLSVTQVDVSDQQPVVGENVTVSATVENAGDVAGNLTVEFTQNEQVVATEQVSNLAGGTTTTVETTVSVDQAGSATAGANGETVTLTVQQPADLSVTQVDVSDQQPVVGENVTVSATVENAGDVAGNLTVEFTQSGSVIATQTVTVPANSTDTVSITSNTFQTGGNVTVTASGNGTSASTTVTVLEPADIQPTDVNVASNVSYGSTFNITATVENLGDLSGSETLTFRVDADDDGDLETIETRTVSIDGEETETITFQFQFDTDQEATPHVGSAFNSSQLVGDTVSLSVESESETQNASVSIDAPDAIGSSGTAQDPDNDGIFEDVSGDGNFGVTDVFRLFTDIGEAENTPGAFDLNGDGEVTVSDVQLLFLEGGS